MNEKDSFHEVCDHCGRHIAVAGHDPDCDADRPDEWPEMFSAAGETPDCPHQFVWDTAEAAYICMYCEESRDEPPERYVDTGTERSGGGR